MERLVQFLDRQSDLLNRPRLHTAQADVRHKKLVLYIESDTSHPVPMDLPLNWDEIFGVIPCQVCGQATPVEDITVCKRCGATHPASSGNIDVESPSPR